ncbi:MAG: NlpC/P60 family protein [Deltaproteobacteria bacterium]|nr:NlpC/P60 family protein [Deltaproteobacteria bacterium]
MRRRIFLWMGLSVLFASFFLCRDGLAAETYKVKRGDTLISIAEKVDVELSALQRANRLKSSKLKANQILIIPGKKSQPVARTGKSAPAGEEFYRVRKGDTPAAIAKKTGVSLADLRKLNNLRGNKLAIGQRLTLRDKKELPGQEKGSSDPARHVQNALIADLDDEEEVDGGVTSLEAWQEIEKRKQDSAALLGNWTTPEEPKLLVKVAMGFLGAPYRLGGSSVTGIDCSAFVKKIYHIFNIDLPRTAFEQSRVGMRVSRSELTVGDLLFFKTQKEVGHVGIYVGNNEFVHASSRKRGVRVDNLDTPYYDQRFVRAVRLMEVNGSL